MSGHSKWSTIKRHKGAQDNARGKLFTKLIREIQVAARMGGGDPGGNPRLREAILDARSNSLPKDKIEKAIQRGTGAVDSAQFESILYEGYGPGGVALLIESLTDNRNRTVGEIRAIMTRNGGNLGESGSVAWNFEKKGIFLIEKKLAPPEETLTEWVLESGAADLQDEGEVWGVLCESGDFEAVKENILARDLKIQSAQLAMTPKNTVRIDADTGKQLVHLIELLEDLDDVQKIHANFEMDAADMARVFNSDK